MLTFGLNLRAVSRATCGRKRAQRCERDGSDPDHAYDSLWSFDMLLLEQELTVEVAQIDRIQVEHLDHSFRSSSESRHDYSRRVCTSLVRGERSTVAQAGSSTDPSS